MNFNNCMSLFIPRVHIAEAREEIIKHILYGLGDIDRVDLVNKGEYFHAFVHFHAWYDSNYTRQLQILIEDRNASCYVKCWSNRPTYFILLKNKNPMTLKEVALERLVKEVEESVDDSRLTPIWCHSVTDSDTVEGDVIYTSNWWVNEKEKDIYNTIEGISANTYLQSDEYHAIIKNLGDLDDMDWLE